MKSIEKPPKWQDILVKSENFPKLLGSDDVKKLIYKAQKEYLYWDSFKHQPIPVGFTAEEVWAFLKLTRNGQFQKTPIRAVGGEFFRFNLVNSLYQKLNYIDTYASGFIRTFSEAKPTEQQKNKFIITSLAEEAIATSQIEGANTTRKAAKEMLETKRPPKNKGEQMVINSYQVMQKLDAWKKLDLGKEMLLEIQSQITEKTLDYPDQQGRFRKDSDCIVVSDRLTGEVVHTPPEEKMMLLELDRLIKFANEEEDDGEFIHPVIKGAILHFWLSYLHPFADGNGRTARAIFYWYLLKKDYWLVQYLSISRAIVQSRKGYDNAFIHSELDGYDMTYFNLFIVEAFKTSIVKFVEYFGEKIDESEKFKKVAQKLEGYNIRQVALLEYFLSHDKETIDVGTYQAKHGIARQTAYTDLLNLEKMGMFVKARKKRKYIFMPNTSLIKKLFQK